MADVTSILNDLIETSKDGEKGFNCAAEDTKNSQLQTTFRQRAKDCARSAADLQQLVARLGGKPEDGGSVAGAVHRGWVQPEGRRRESRRPRHPRRMRARRRRRQGPLRQRAQGDAAAGHPARRRAPVRWPHAQPRADPRSARPLSRDANLRRCAQPGSRDAADDVAARPRRREATARGIPAGSLSPRRACRAMRSPGALVPMARGAPLPTSRARRSTAMPSGRRSASRGGEGELEADAARAHGVVVRVARRDRVGVKGGGERLHFRHVRPRLASEIPRVEPVLDDEAHRVGGRPVLDPVGAHQHVPHQLGARVRVARAQRRIAHRGDVGVRFRLELFHEMGHSIPRQNVAGDFVAPAAMSSQSAGPRRASPSPRRLAATSRLPRRRRARGPC